MTAASRPARGDARLPGGVRLHFRDEGRGDCVVLLHGGMGDCDSWEPQFAVLRPRFRVISYSRRDSHPNTNGPSGNTHMLERDVEDLRDFLRCLSVDCCHLVGTSYGALVALGFGLHNAIAVRSLVLCEPPLHAWARHTPLGTSLYNTFMLETWLPARASFEQGDPTTALELLSAGMSGAPVFHAWSQERRRAALRNGRAMQALTASTDPFPDLPRQQIAAIKAPLLLLSGANTGPLHRVVMEELARSMPAAPWITIPDAGHGVSAENPAAFTAALVTFFRGSLSPCDPPDAGGRLSCRT